MWGIQIVLMIIGLSSGIVVAGGLFALLISLGVISKFASRTHTGDAVLFYEECIGLGASLGNLFFLYQIHIPGGAWIVPVWGIAAGIFVGCWAMALAEIINIFPVFIRRVKLVEYVPIIVVSLALGKGIGAVIMFIERWGSK